MSLVLSASSATFAHYSDAGNNLDALAVQAIQDTPANMGRCHYGQDDPVNEFPRPDCSSNASKPTVAIWGDSYALAWQPFAYAVAEHDGRSATSFSRDSCRPVLSLGDDTPRARSCHAFNQRVVAHIKHQRFNTLVLAGMWTPPMLSGLRATVAELAPYVGRILVIGPTPQLRESAPQCIQSGRLDRCARPRADFEHSTRATRERLASLPVEVVDPTDFFCTATECPVLKDGRSLYWNDDHVASSAARGFAKSYLREQVAKQIPRPVRSAAH